MKCEHELSQMETACAMDGICPLCLDDRCDVLSTALQRIVGWSEAYPLDMFPEPDFKKAHALLEAGGITLDAVSASCMRHVVQGVGRIAREALDQ